MGCFEVLESGEGIQEEIAHRLQDAGALACGWFSPSRPALLIISPRVAAQTHRLELGCRTVLLPGDAPAQHWQLQAASAVSYGPGPRDTLTLSSREGNQLLLALQREVVTVQGQVVERQEFPLSIDPGPIHPGRPGGSRGAAAAWGPPGALELAFAISYLTSRDLWTTIKILPTPGGCHP